MTPRIVTTAGGIVLDVKVVPNSSRDQIAGVLGEALKVKVAAPPEDGKANRAVCRLLADALSLPPSAVTVVHGQSQPNKRIAITGIDEATARSRLQ